MMPLSLQRDARKILMDLIQAQSHEIVTLADLMDFFCMSLEQAAAVQDGDIDVFTADELRGFAFQLGQRALEAAVADERRAALASSEGSDLKRRLRVINYAFGCAS